MATVWSRVNLLTMVSVGIVVMPFVARGDRWILLWTFLGAMLAAGVWFFALANAARRPGSTPSGSGGSISGHSITTAVVAAVAMILFALVIVPRINSAHTSRPREVAAAIRNALPPSAQLWVFEDRYKPFWYYLEPNVRYFRRLTDLPSLARYILVPAAQTKSFLQDPRLVSFTSTVLLHAVDSEGKPFDLISRTPT